MIQAVIFDMDGVLIDSEYLSDQYYLTVFKDLGFSPAASDFEMVRGFNGHAFWTYFSETYNIPYPSEEFKHRTRLRFIEFLKTQNPTPIPGVEELLQELTKRKVKIALASSGSNIRIAQQIKLIKLTRYFKVIVSGEEVTHSKPHAEIYLKAAEKLGVNPKDCVAIEDATNGVESAKKAGMKVMGYKSKANIQNLSQADLVVDSFKNISIDTIVTL